MRTFRQFMCETPDDVYAHPMAVTFYLIEHPDDVEHALRRDREVWDSIDEHRPWFARTVEAALDTLPYPCLVTPDGARSTNVAIMRGNQKRILKGDHPTRTHLSLAGTLMHGIVGEYLTGKFGSRLPAEYADVRDNIGDMLDGTETEIGIAGRFTEDYLATWRHAALETVRWIMDEAERGRVIRFKDTVMVDTSADDDSDENEYPVSRLKSGRFGS